MTLPLVGEDGERVGSLVIWQTRDVVDSPFPHFHVIAGDLRAQIEPSPRALADGACFPRVGFFFRVTGGLGARGP